MFRGSYLTPGPRGSTWSPSLLLALTCDFSPALCLVRNNCSDMPSDHVWCSGSPVGKGRALFHEEAMKSLPRRVAVFFLYTSALSAGLPLGRSHESSDSLYISHVAVTPKSPLCNFLWPSHPTGLPWNVLLLALSLFQIFQHCHRENTHTESWDRAY